MAEAALLVRSFQVGLYTATITVPKPAPGVAASIFVEWSPDLPESLTPLELEQYQAGRGAVAADLAQALGRSVAVVEVG